MAQAPRWTSQQLEAHLEKKRIEREGPAPPKKPTPAVKEERNLQKDCQDWLDGHQIYWVHFRDSRGEREGIPDLLICYRGEFVGVELKSETGKVKKEQKEEMTRIRKSGGRTFVARSLPEFIRKLTTGVNEKYPL